MEGAPDDPDAASSPIAGAGGNHNHGGMRITNVTHHQTIEIAPGAQTPGGRGRLGVPPPQLQTTHHGHQNHGLMDSSRHRAPQDSRAPQQQHRIADSTALRTPRSQSSPRTVGHSSHEHSNRARSVDRSRQRVRPRMDSMADGGGRSPHTRGGARFQSPPRKAHQRPRGGELLGRL